MLDNPGHSPVARAARQAADDWAASPPSDLLRSNPGLLAKNLHAYADKLLETKNPDPSKPAFVSMSVSLPTAANAQSFAYANLLSPAWRAEHGLGPVGGSSSPEQTQRGLALIEARKSELARASVADAEAPEVVQARQRLESVAQEKLSKENMGVIISSGNANNAPGYDNLFDAPSILSVGTTTDDGEPFAPSDRGEVGRSLQLEDRCRSGANQDVGVVPARSNCTNFCATVPGTTSNSPRAFATLLANRWPRCRASERTAAHDLFPRDRPFATRNHEASGHLDYSRAAERLRADGYVRSKAVSAR